MPARRREALPKITWALRLAAVGLVAAFVHLFNPHRPQVFEDTLLLGGLLALVLATWIDARPTRPFPRPARADVALVLAMNAVFCALWLPHYDNWRWAYTGDSIAWYGTAAIAADRGLDRNLLSMRGVDFHFTYLHSLASNALLFAFEPTLFWHRVGKMLVTAAGLTAIFTFVRITVGRWWGLAIAACAAVNFYLVRMSYVSYGHIDSLLFCFAAFTLAALIWRRQDDARLWLLAGINAGLALFFTQTAWSGIAVSGLCLIGLALRKRRFRELATCGAGFVVCAVPIALQWQDFLHLISSQTKPNLAWSYLWSMSATLFRLPFEASYTAAYGIAGGFLQEPLGTSFVAGVALSAAACLPPVRRLLRLPRVVPALLAMLLIEIALMTLTNNGYGNPSTNRTYHMIPLQILIACVPMVALCAGLRRWPVAHVVGVVATFTVLALYAERNLQILIDPPAHIFGSKTTDGFIELHQRHPELHALYLVSVPPELADYAPGSFFDQTYGLASSVTAVEQVDGASIEAACEAGDLLCCHHGAPCATIDRVVAELAWQLVDYPTVNSRSLRCSTCVPRPSR